MPKRVTKQARTKPRKANPAPEPKRSAKIASKPVTPVKANRPSAPKAAAGQPVAAANKPGTRGKASELTMVAPKAAETKGRIATRSNDRVAGASAGGATKVSEESKKAVIAAKATGAAPAKANDAGQSKSNSARPSKVNGGSSVKPAGNRPGNNGTSVERKRPPVPRVVMPLPEGLTLADDDAPIPKTKLTPEQLEEFRELLLKKRAELHSDVHHLTNEALGRNRRENSGDLSAMPIHMADLGSDNWEQEFTLGLIANESALIRDIDAALERIDHGTYGICLATHKPISLARLRATPWAKYCIEYTRLKEQGRVP